MQTLEPPYPVVDGYALLPDHADPALWYALPIGPRLAMVGGRPQLSLTQYLGGGAGSAKIAGGILQITTELAIDDDVLAALPAKLAARLGPGKPTPIVTPLQFDSGTVEIAVLGRTNAPQPEGSAAPGGPFEVQFIAGGKPSLGGTNNCTFQLVLNENAAVAIAACLDQPELPVIVSYVMSYSALRPSFTIDIHADWHKVYSTLQDKLTTNAWFVAADVDTEITHALETSGIDVDTVVLGGADSAAAAAKTKEKLLDWVLEKLFVPMIPAQSPGQQIGQVIEGAVWSLTRAIIPGASYRLKSIDQDQLRHMDIRATERLAEVRELRPQGMLGELLRGLRLDEHGNPSPQWPAIRSGMLAQIELTGFPRLEVAVSVVDRFASDRLRNCRVQIARLLPDGSIADSAEFVFTGAGTPQDWVVNLLDDAAREAVWKTPYVYRVLAEFDPASPLQPAGPAISPWRSKSAAGLLVDPREAYAVSDVTVTVAPLFAFEAFPAVTVELCPGLADPNPAKAARLNLTAASNLQHWQFSAIEDAADGPAPTPAIPQIGFGAPAGQPAADVTPVETVVDGSTVVVARADLSAADPGFSWRATYHRPLESGGDVAGAWSTAVEPWLSLPDPMPEKLQVNFFIDLPWNDITAALLQLRYEDEAANIHYAVETITLNAATAVLNRTYSIAAGGSRSVGYRLTIKLASGPLMEGSWRLAGDDRVIIDRTLVDRREISLRVLGGTLADQHLAGAKVTLQVRDPKSAQVLAATDLVIPPGAEKAYLGNFSYLRGDPPINLVFFQVSATDPNGFRRAQPWGSSTADLLVLDLRTLSVAG